MTAMAAATITRPANTTAYAAGDAVGDVSGSAVVELSLPGFAAGWVANVLSVELAAHIAAVPVGMTGFKLHLFNASPTSIADNAAFNLAAADRVKYLGHVALDTPLDFGDTLYSQNVGACKPVKLSTDKLYAVLVTDAGFTPGSGDVFGLSLFVSEMNA